MTSYIGTYGEKTLHRALKRRLDPTGECHEVRVGRYIADIKTESGIIEIQTQSFFKLRAKLGEFLPDYPVTLVYPIAREKILVWPGGPGGVAARECRSPKRGSYYDAFRELYQIKTLLTDRNLSIMLLLIDVSEHRVASKGYRKKYSKIDTELRSLYGEMILGCAGDYKKLIPGRLAPQFTVRDYSMASGLSLRDSGLALNVLHHVGAAARVGKQGRSYLYERAQAGSQLPGEQQAGGC